MSEGENELLQCLFFSKIILGLLSEKVFLKVEKYQGLIASITANNIFWQVLNFKYKELQNYIFKELIKILQLMDCI